VLVTGGGQRIGAAIALRFAGAGHDVILHCRRSTDQAEVTAKAARALGVAACVLAADLADRDAVSGLIDRALAAAPDLGVLVNCASMFEPDMPDRPEPDQWAEAMAVNALAPCRLAADLHRAVSGAVVVNILDQKLANPNPDYFSYTASKAALAEATRMQAMAFAGRTTVVAVAPGLTLPSGDQTAEEYAISSTLNLLKRATSAQEVADAVVFAASGALATGETLYVDGGQHLTPQSRDVMFLVRGER
jgi:NAD(P)-dependent dehydrogenase (short-subunit alcohol dehydrogenase family)